MTFSRLLSPQVWRHTVGWLLVLGICSALEHSVGKFRIFGIPYSPVVLLVPVLTVYIHFWLLDTLLARRRYGLYVAATALTIAAGTVLLTGMDYYVQAKLRGAVLTLHFSSEQQQAAVLQAAANIVAVLLLSTLVRYQVRGVRSAYQVRKLRALQLETELSLLKAQVNQHFLFNTLNNLYGLSLSAPDQIPEALLQLADLMRYQLDSSRQQAVTVGSEAEYLANYIGLEKLRLQANTHVEYLTDLAYPAQPVAALLLLPLVENCFKHAVGPDGATTIRICLTQTATGLTLRTDNSIPAHFRPRPSGLGLPTLRARLAQFYPGTRHSLVLEATAHHYTATLHLVF